VKTVKLRVFPTQAQKETLQTYFDQYRWYYNAILSITYARYGIHLASHPSYRYETLRDLMKQYRFYEDEHGKNFEWDIFRNELPVPEWWEDSKMHNRIPRGAVLKFTEALNAAITNFKEGHSKTFKMHFQTRKSPHCVAHFEDKGYPAWLRTQLQSRYWYTTSDRKRHTLSLAELPARGLEILYNRDTDRYFIHAPVDQSWYPENDKRLEKQDRLNFKGSRVIALDPGVRKFMVGYDPHGSLTFVGEGAREQLAALLLTLDKALTPRDQRIAWHRVRHLVDELHWKTINYLVEHYDTILLPDFPVQQMIQGHKLSRMVKRLMLVFSFYKFRMRLKWKCETHHKTLHIVKEDYTSRTCGQCGHVKEGKFSDEIYKCRVCKFVVDRDVNGARNIYLKNHPTLGLDVDLPTF
jgi:IS605 OrfB family transposase